MRTVAFCTVALALALSACGGGGSGGSEVDRFLSDPRFVSFQGVTKRADTLLASHAHSRYTVTVSGRTESRSESQATNCAGTRCIFADGHTLTVENLFGPPDRVRPGARGGFDTAAFTFSGLVENPLAGGALNARSETTHYGFWGEHGFAALVLGKASLSGAREGSPARGMHLQMGAVALGLASRTNPAGTGSATWTGIAEAARKDTSQRLQGTVTVNVADLARPRVGVAINVPGHAIGAPGWADMALANGRFISGTLGTDGLVGSFFGLAHQEAWGVFDTTSFVGAFGAKRNP